MIRTRMIAAACAFAAIGLSAGSASAEEIFVKVTTPLGVFEGWQSAVDVLGEVSLADYGQVEALKWSVVVPVQAGSGLPTSQRQYRPLEIRVPMSGGVVEGLNALRTNASMTVEILWFTQDGVGAYLPARVLTLTDARCIEVAAQTVREDGQTRTVADLRFAIRTIGITDYLSGLSFADSWGETAQ